MMSAYNFKIGWKGRTDGESKSKVPTFTLQEKPCP